MLATTHVLVGASVGRFVPDPAVAFAIAVGSHFVLDKIPHFWPNKLNKQVIILAVEWTVAVIFILFLSDNPAYLYSQFMGAIGGFMPDIVLLPLVKTKIGAWHAKRQKHGQSFVYVLPEVFLILFSAFILVFWRQ